MNALITRVSKENFEQEVILSKQPVLIDFWADWCAPCRVVAPILDDIAKEYEKELKVVKINTDEEADLADQFQITSIPTLVLYYQENEVGRMLGAQPKENIEAFLNEHII